MKFILIIFMATSSTDRAGAGAVSATFADQQACVTAGVALTKQGDERGNFTLSWGCFPESSKEPKG